MSETDLSWVDGDVDVETPNAARMYDYYLGGSHNFAHDRAAAARALEVTPAMIPGARANRAFLQRVVRYCLDAGIRQFLDLGSGIPTVGHVSEIAHAVDPSARVAYVDLEPVAVAHTYRMLADVPTVSVTQADLQEPQAVLNAPGVAGLLDFNQPVAVLAVAVLHFVPDAKDPAAILDAYCAAVPTGSVLAVSHITDHYDTPERVAEIGRLYSSTTNAARHRSFADFTALLGNRELVDPGAVYVTDWRPSAGSVPADSARTAFWGALVKVE